MKILTRFFLLTVFFNISYNCIGQIDFEKEYKKLKIIVSDSLKGFDEQLIKKIAIEQGFLGKETYAYLLRNARQYINHKYGIIENITQSKTGNSQTMGPPCNNEDFEAGNSSGWTLQSQSWTSGPCVGNTFSAGAPEFWVLATPIADPQFPGGIPNSPLGGNFVAKLNDVNPTGGSTMMRQTFPVTSNNCLFQFAWAACFDGSGHGCCDNPFLTIRVLDCNNNVLSCPQISIVASGPSCSSGMPGFTQNSSGYMIKNWTQQAIDLTPYIGSCVTIEVFVADCTGGAHHGYAYFDALCSPMYVSVNNIQYPITTNTIFACGITNANIAAPPGLGPYNWNGPPGSGINNLNQQSFNTSTPGTYTLTVNPTGGCGPITRTLNIQFQPNPNAGFNMVNNCQNFTITNTGSGPPSIQTYSFIGSSAPASFTTTSTTTNVSFSAGGQYTVLQSVFNGSCSANHSIVINVPNPLIVNFNVSNVCQNTPVTFTNTSNPITGVNHFWDFDNNGIWDSNNPSPSNLYAPGNYTVKLKVVAPSGCVDSISKPVSVWGRAVPDFTFNPVCYGTPVNFTNNTSTTANPNTGSISLYQWYFGDGNQSNASGPSHLYASPSNSVTNTTYSIKLVVTTSNGCKDSVQKNITVFSNPSANFIADSVCLGNLTTLQDLSNGNGNPLFQFQWDFNNDNSPDLINNSLSTQYIFPVSGNNVVNYTVVTNTGAGTLTCKSYTTKNVWVHYIPCLLYTS
ncbi:MAG: PKD domain-containing protein, partial [Bacteroidia bacterium]|nr:PKD domain-containing protein [Bacteroidia bacterium]